MLVAGAVVLGALLWFGLRVLASPDVVLLRGEAGARWIGISRDFVLSSWKAGPVPTTFRTRFEVAAAPPEAVLRVRALRSAVVILDGRVVLPREPDLAKWKEERSVDLSPGLSPGRHDLKIRVLNESGPALLLAHCAPLGLATGEGRGWASSLDGERWWKVADVDHRRLPEYFDDFLSSSAALIARWPLFALVFALAGGLSLLAGSGGPGARLLSRLDAGHLRWALLLAWAVLALNNLVRIPLDFGFDADGHAEYIRFIAERGRLPLATDGWEMFQSPLYYVLAALPYAALSPEGAVYPDDFPRALLLIPLVCGALQIQLAYLATRRVFPSRGDLQALGTLVGGFLPINLYASPHIGNEPLAALLSSTALVVAFGLLAPGAPADRRRDWALLGALVGLALLAKSTAVLLIPPLLLTLGWKQWGDRRDLRALAARIGLFLAVALLLCGWHYARNWIELSDPFPIGTESGSWWQDPGYRTPRDFFAFGAALEQPLYAGVHGFWNGFYATLWSDGFYSGRIPLRWAERPWNENFLIAGSLFGLLPTLALVLGMSRAPRRRQTALALLSLLSFLAAMLYIYLRVPHYSAVKASYTLGLVPCYAVLAASGLEAWVRRPMVRSAVAGLLACGAVSAYLAYFVGE